MKKSTHVLRAILVGIFCFTAVSSIEVDFRDEYLFVHSSNAPSDEMRLVVLTWPENREIKQVENCVTFNDKARVSEALRTSENPQILRMTNEEIAGLLIDCNEISRRRKKRETPSDGLYSDRVSRDEESPNSVDDTPAAEDSGWWHVIWPGTKWCGTGDDAENDDDLGESEETDKCCRAHDKCPDLMFSGKSKYQLTNTSPFTKLSCKCDEAFYDCLQQVDTMSANSIGNLYFNILDRECYEEDYPDSTECEEYYSFLKIKCKVFKKDTTAPKVYMWKESKYYNKLPVPW